MKKFLFPAILAFLGIQTNAQEIFAITGKQVPQIVFNDLRALDLTKGTSGEIFFTEQSTPKVFSQNLQSNFTESKASIHNSQTASMASLALDVKTNSLVFVPMFSSNIYVMNNRTKEITLVENQAIKSVACNIGSHITRMAATNDGNIYAMSNSGSQLVKVSSENGRYSVQDLGSIKDISANPEISLSVMMTGFGGDMVADAANNLYVISATNNIFKINLGSLSSEFVGKISGLPANYTTNGAAINAAGNIIVGNAKGEGLYEVNFKSLEAKAVSGDFKMPIYDLASAYFLNDAPVSATNNTISGIEIYPTKVNQQFFNIKIDNENVKGNLKVELADYMGNKLMKQNINVIRNNSEFKINLSNYNAGVYIVNISDTRGNTIFNTKIIIEK
ncbi:T9SS type A sorting domain-containing protein [Frigoriflavimonas asaccharolytica]|uniref:Secretion system C-terminal sorting domain-containing protein n=1 Tax=Frigoriflavimonas asaccharolytica TaxID=2735899 RepID=A0A8J8GCY9_9FLAO|nr:T9SS type A sorting domain-containing protein [Frigoriflavimonas asaccharolytica]NRS93670.1 hypothetical protein [Frigoriflavimonas asaccharolytica]